MTELKVRRKPFYYDAQIKRYLVQIMAMFSGYQIMTGKQRDGEVRFIDVPVVHGGADRVVQYNRTGGNMNKVIALPIISVVMKRMELNRDRRRAPTHVNTAQFSEYQPNAIEEGNAEAEGGAMKKRAVDRYMPTPYDAFFDLNIWTSNMTQMVQLIEQIGQHFNMNMDMQMSNSPFDWTSITTVQFDGNIEFNPAPELGNGSETQPMVATLSFQTVLWLSPPAIIRDADEVAKIQMDFLQMNEPVDFDTMQDLDSIIIVGNAPDDD